VRSRRFGMDLGINLSPSQYKLCSFNCTYCQYGWTVHPTTKVGGQAADLPSLADIETALGDVLREQKTRNLPVDHLSVAGNGEPLLHPQFPGAMQVILRLRDAYFSAAKIAVLTNSQMVIHPAVRQALMLADERCLKLDAGDERLLRRLNRPAAPFDFNAMLAAMRQLGDFTIQTMFVQGSIDNAADAAVSLWIDKIRFLQPKHVHVYSLDRVPADSGLGAVSRARLEAIAQTLQQQTGISAEVFA